MGRLSIFLIGFSLVFHSCSCLFAGTVKNLGAFCSNDTTLGDPNLNPIDETPAQFINKVENGSLYKIGSGEDQMWLVHVYGDTGYDFGFAYGTLLREQIQAMVPQAWAHFEQEVEKALEELKLPKWFADLIAEEGLDVALDVQNELVKKYMDEEIYNEIRGIADASKMDYKTAVRLHMLGEITRGRDIEIN